VRLDGYGAPPPDTLTRLRGPSGGSYSDLSFRIRNSGAMFAAVLPPACTDPARFKDRTAATPAPSMLVGRFY